MHKVTRDSNPIQIKYIYKHRNMLRADQSTTHSIDSVKEDPRDHHREERLVMGERS